MPGMDADADAEKARSVALTKRLISGFILGPLTLALILAGGWYFLAFVTIAGIISLYEWANMAKTSPRPTKFMFAGGVYVTFCLSSYVFLRFGFMQGAWLALSIMLAVWASDTGAYATGRMIGGAKLCPKISPNKTWAGFGGALFFSGLMLMIMAGTGHFFDQWLKTDVGLKPKHVWYVFFIGCFLGAVAQAGDLLISWFKRRAGLKDTGDLIPGHGGLLDRIDSLLLVSPVFLLIMMAWAG
jgi:phosphatidate cytidylyltransferase